MSTQPLAILGHTALTAVALVAIWVIGVALASVNGKSHYNTENLALGGLTSRGLKKR